MIVENIRLGIECTDADAIREAVKRLGKVSDSPGRIYKKSIDARHKNNIKFVYSVLFEEDKEDNNFDCIQVKPGENPQKSSPVIIGFGSAGIFCALVLAQNGYKPVVFEMGSDIDTRIKKVDKLFNESILDEKTNVCFGEGGAGTFSDGKLVTRINDPYCGFVLRQFVKSGAPESILYQAKPHVGTDIIRIGTKRIREEIIKNGGEIYFDSEVTDINSGFDGIEITVNKKDKIKTSGLFIAAGHSAFRIYDLLIKRGFSVEPKPYSVGFRIEHKQSYIDDIIYGNQAGNKNLPPAEYALSHKKPDTRGVYTFCMCPGGVVVNSVSENGTIVTNGMSYSDRAGENANSAVAVSVLPEDYGGTVSGAFEFRKKLEESAFKIKNRDFTAPVQTLGDYINNKTGSLQKSDISPSYTGKFIEYDLNKLFPEFLNQAIKTGVKEFDKTLKGWFYENAVLTAPETRTSSAVRIVRDNTTLEAINFDGIYPCGEGAGYAGGITSSAVDGIKCAVKYMEKYRK
ncbi:MAG: hypothetical protein FWD71_14825 [Oscillospiraceae bacterium]|nr:hypothetical protein [Oscillospiraceae bacterium]